MAFQPDTIGRGLVAEQAPACWLTDIEPAQPSAVGAIDVKVEQPGRRLAVLKGDTGLFGYRCRQTNRYDRIRSKHIPALCQRLERSEATFKLGQSPSKQVVAAGQILAGAGQRRRHEDEAGRGRAEHRIQHRFPIVPGRQDLSF